MTIVDLKCRLSIARADRNPQCQSPIDPRNRQSPIANRQSPIVNRQSSIAIVNRQSVKSAIINRQSAID
jgi:hypothetical protein